MNRNIEHSTSNIERGLFGARLCARPAAECLILLRLALRAQPRSGKLGHKTEAILDNDR